jgi:hypothetical protein
MLSGFRENKDELEKREYRSPVLLNYGDVRKLTQNGTAVTKENNGQNRCGAGFDKSGNSSC